MPKNESGRARGRPERKFSEEDKKIVIALARARLPQALIAKAIHANERTLVKHFGEILETEYLRYTAKVVGTLAEMIEEKDRAAVFFYLKTRCGWRETDGPDEGKSIDKLPRVTLEIIQKPNVE